MDSKVKQWYESREQICNDFEESKINFEEKARRLTEAECNYRDIAFSMYLSYPNLINFTNLYNYDISMTLTLNMVIIFHSVYESTIEYVLDLEHIEYLNKLKQDEYIFYHFFYCIDNARFPKKFSLGIMDRSQWTVSESFFRHLINQTPLINIFGTVNYGLKKNIEQIPNKIYWAINNGHAVRQINNHFTEGSFKGVKPHFSVDLNFAFRSIWEANIARLLNYLGLEWEYEKTHLIIGSEEKPMIYNPDFFLKDNSIIEIKGFWNNDSLKKVYAFKSKQFAYPSHLKNYNEQFVNSNLYIIDHDMYISIDRIYSKLIENWESLENVRPISDVFLVGINRPERIDYTKALTEKSKVYFERENNKFDQNAIKVLDEKDNMLGYLSKEWACIYAEKMDLGMKYKAKVKKIESTFIRLEVERINLDEPILYDFLKPPSQ